MKRNMQKWAADLLAAPIKKPLPILSFPCVSLLGISVKQLISDSEWQAKGMQLVAQRTDAAAAVSLMDLSVEAECFGAQTVFADDEVPNVTGSIVSSEEDAQNLQVPPVGSARSGLYIEAIKKAVERITDRPVLAGVIGPFSLAGRLMDVSEAMIYCYDEPDMVHTVLQKTTAFLKDYCLAYKQAGANGVVIAEPLAGLLSPTLAAEFSTDYVREIVSAVQDENFIVVYHNCGDYTVQMAADLATIGAAAYHFGNAIHLQDMLDKMPADVLVMGNIDPAGQLKNGTPESVADAVTTLLDECGQYPNFVLSSGCDIPPTTPWENIDAFFKAFRSFYHLEP